VYENEEPAGCGALRDFSPGIMELKRMYVPEYKRRKGIASLVLAELERWCRELHCTTCVLETGLNQPEAIAFYEQHQYGQIPKFGKYMDSPNSICFEKKL
jgi:GNAT superfamily N-acetyltransferase